MICAMALPVFAAGLCLDREPGAPWVRFPAPGDNPVWIDPTSVKQEGAEKTVRFLDPAETAATGDVWVDISFDCTARRAWVIRVTQVKDGKAGEVSEIPPEARQPMDLDDEPGTRLRTFVCDGKTLG